MAQTHPVLFRDGMEKLFFKRLIDPAFYLVPIGQYVKK